MKVAKIDGAYNRRFIREVYEKNDGKAKDAIMNYLIKNGHEILDSQENFSFDIKSKKEDNIYFSEAEMKISGVVIGLRHGRKSGYHIVNIN